MPKGEKDALSLEYIKQDIKSHNFGLLCAPLLPLLLIHWIPPHWSPLRPWLPAGVLLTFNPWPTVPQNSSQGHQLNSQRGAHPVNHCDDNRGGRQWVQVSQMFFAPPSHLPFSLCLQHIVPVRSQKPSQRLSHSEFVYVCMSWSHLSWCSWVKEKIPLLLDEKLPATERSGFKSEALSSLLKKHVPRLCSYVGKWKC